MCSRKTVTLKYALILFCSLFIFSNIQAQKEKTVSDRKFWLDQMDKISRPVIKNLAEDKLRAVMPVLLSKRTDNANQRAKVAYLEAFGRTLCGIAPWLNSEGGTKEEVALRNQYREWTLKAIANAVDPSAKDYMVWNEGGQQLVDASFVALGLVRSPWLWTHLDQKVQKQVVDAFKLTRAFVPVYSNWLLFTGMIEAFFCKYGLEYDKVRLDYGIREFAHHWYTGDGMFSDGMNFNLDYYNSFVIQPYLGAILEIVSKQSGSYNFFLPRFEKISKRYAEIQERMVNADGSFPVIGRSIVYRGAAFHHLADVYNNTGSLYLCTTIFLPLGLPDTDEFWSAPAEPWTALKVWTGQDAPGDHALEIR